MSAKADQIVMERRLKPIYDAIDSGNPKKAAQEADKVLKKHPGTVCAKVLKALAFLRSDRLTEAWAIIDELDVAGVRYDEQTLQAFVHCFREADTPGRISQLYERAVAVLPNENNLTQLFMAYVRNRQFTKQQQVAVRLYKEFPANPPYLFWGIQSIVMQALDNPVMGQKMFYPLAEKMFQNYLAKNFYKSSSEIELHLMIMEGQQRYLDADKLITSPLMRNMQNVSPHFTLIRHFQYLQSAGEYSAVIDESKSIVPANLDDWQLWNILMNAYVSKFHQLRNNGDGSDVAELTALVQDVSSIVFASSYSQGRARGPWLIQFELIKRLAVTDEPVRELLGTNLVNPVDLMFAYVRKFYEKPCCYNDLEQFLSILSEDEKQELIKRLNDFIKDNVNEDDVNSKNHERSLWLIVVFERLRRRFGFYETLSKDELMSYAGKLVHKAMGAKDDQTGSALIKLAVDILWKQWRDDGDMVSLHNLLLISEMGIQKFKTDSVLKLILLRAHGELGVLNRVVALQKLLEIKSVQKDSMGHYIWPVYEHTGRFKMALIHYSGISDMFMNAEKETTDMLIAAYRNGSFPQVPDITKLLGRILDSSFQLAAEVMNRCFSALYVVDEFTDYLSTLEGLEGMDSQTDFTKLIDNRDFAVIPSFESEDTKALVEEHQKESHQELVDATKLHHLLLRTIAGIHRTQQFPDALSVLHECLHEVRERHPSEKPINHVMQSAVPLRLAAWVHSKSWTPILTLLNCGLKVVVTLERKETPSGLELPSDDDLRELLKAAIGELDASVATTSYGIHEPLFAATRALNTLAYCRVILMLLATKEKPNSATWANAHRSKPASAKDKPKTPYAIRCMGLQKVVTDLAQGEMSAHLRKLREAVSAGTFLPKPTNYFPAGPVWEIIEEQNNLMGDRIMKTYANCIDDMLDICLQRFS